MILKKELNITKVDKHLCISKARAMVQLFLPFVGFEHVQRERIPAYSVKWKR